ncbi:hypothetical protein OESDEN_23844, partial [Oesophagostomum dentatum]
VPPPANVTAQPQPEEAPAGEAAPEAVAHAEEEHNSDGDDDPFAYSSHNEDMATDSTQDSSDDDVTDSTSTSEDSDEKNRRKSGFQATPTLPLFAVNISESEHLVNLFIYSFYLCMVYNGSMLLFMSR